MDKKYIINEHGVCINPDEEILYQKDRIEVAIETATINELWSYGLRIELVDCGMRSPVTFDWHVFETKEEARLCAIDEVIRYMRSNNGNHGIIYENVITEVLSKVNEQLTLF